MSKLTRASKEVKKVIHPNVIRSIIRAGGATTASATNSAAAAAVFPDESRSKGIYTKIICSSKRSGYLKHIVVVIDACIYCCMPYSDSAHSIG